MLCYAMLCYVIIYFMFIYYRMGNTKEYVVNNFLAFTIVGVIIKLFFTSDTTVDGSSGPANAAIWGYGVVALAVFAVMFLSFALASNVDKSLEGMQAVSGFIKALLADSLPTLITLLIVVWIITLNTTYFKRINQGRVSSDYNTFSTVSTIFLIIQLGALFSWLHTQVSTGGDSKMLYVVYILSFINVLFIGVMNIILRFFSTDG
jgi:hypothetical protein